MFIPKNCLFSLSSWWLFQFLFGNFQPEKLETWFLFRGWYFVRWVGSTNHQHGLAFGREFRKGWWCFFCVWVIFSEQTFRTGAYGLSGALYPGFVETLQVKCCGKRPYAAWNFNRNKKHLRGWLWWLYPRLPNTQMWGGVWAWYHPNTLSGGIWKTSV